MRPLIDWLRTVARPDRRAPPRRSDAPQTTGLRVKSAAILECVSCGRRKPRAGAWTPALSPADTQPIYTVCADCVAKRNPT